MLKIFMIFLLFFISNLYSFSVKPGKFDVICESGNKVVLQYELKCTKKESEFIKIKYWNLKGYISNEKFIMPKLPIKLEPDKEAKKIKILIKTPMTNNAENILKISFVDIPVGPGEAVSIASMLSTRTYIRYKDKAILSYKIANFSFSTKRVRSGKIIKYLNINIKNDGNTYIRPNGYVVFSNKKNEYKYLINQFEFPVYSGKNRNLITEINNFPKKGGYTLKIFVNTKLGESKIFKYKVDISDDAEVTIIK